MPAEIRPSSPLATRVLRQVVRRLAGKPDTLGVQLGSLVGPRATDTSLADSPELRAYMRAESMRAQLWSDEADAARRRRYVLYEELRTIPEIRQILRHMCAFIFGGDAHSAHLPMHPFFIDFADGAPDDAIEAITSSSRAMQLTSLIPQQVESGLLKGDAFGEIVHTLTEVVGCKAHIAKTVDVLWSPLDTLVGYQVRPIRATGSAKRLSPLQVVHFAPHRRFGQRYGESFFYGLISTGRQFNTAIDVIHTLIVLASTNRRTVALEHGSGNMDEMRDYIRKIRTWNSDGAFFDGDGVMQKSIAAMLDYTEKIFPYRKGSQPPVFHDERPADFSKLLEVAKFDQGRFYLGTGFPKALAGLLEDAAGLGGGSALTSADLALARVLRFYQADSARLVLEYIGKSALVHDVEIEPEHVSVRMPPVGAFNEKLVAETIKFRAEAAKNLSEIHVPIRWIYKNLLRVPDSELEDLVAQTELARSAAGQEPGGALPTTAETARLNAMLGEQIERMQEAARLLQPISVALDDERVIAALASARQTP